MSSALPPWDSLGFTFGTEPAVLTSVPQCSTVTVDYYDTIDGGKFANPPPTAPHSIVVYAGGSQYLSIPLGNNATSGQYRWRMNLPPGQTYGVSMKDSNGYSGGILTPNLKVVPGTNCSVASPLKPANLGVTVSGSSQCGQTVVVVSNGTAPYTVEVVPADNRQQKTIHFATSPFAVTLDIGAGIQYFLSITDSAGHSSVQGVYTVAASSDNSCLGAATTITAGMYSTLYPGGTAISSATASTSATSSPGSNKLGSGAVIGIAVAVPVGAIILVLLGLWICYRRNHRQRRLDAAQKPEIDPYEPEQHTIPAGYAPVPTSYFGSGQGGSSYHDLSSASGSQHPLGVTDRQTIVSEGSMGYNSAGVSSMGVSEKRRNLLNPDSHGLGPIASEPFDPNPNAPQSRMPPLPPAYSPSLGHT